MLLARLGRRGPRGRCGDAQRHRLGRRARSRGPQPGRGRPDVPGRARRVGAPREPRDCGGAAPSCPRGRCRRSRGSGPTSRSTPVRPSGRACSSTTARASSSARPPRSAPTSPSTTASRWAARASTTASATPRSATGSPWAPAPRCSATSSSATDSRIGANAVLVRSVDDHSVVVGVPGQVIAHGTSPEADTRPEAGQPDRPRPDGPGRVDPDDPGPAARGARPRRGAPPSRAAPQAERGVGARGRRGRLRHLARRVRSGRGTARRRPSRSSLPGRRAHTRG